MIGALRIIFCLRPIQMVIMLPSFVCIYSYIPTKDMFIASEQISILLQTYIYRSSVATREIEKKRELQTIMQYRSSKHDFGKRTFQGSYAEIICKLLVERSVCSCTKGSQKSERIVCRRYEYDFCACVWCKICLKATIQPNVNKGQDPRNFCASRYYLKWERKRGNRRKKIKFSLIRIVEVKPVFFQIIYLNIFFLLKNRSNLFVQRGKDSLKEISFFMSLFLLEESVRLFRCLKILSWWICAFHFNLLTRL